MGGGDIAGGEHVRDCKLTWSAQSAIQECKNYIFPVASSHCNFIFNMCAEKQLGVGK